MHGVMAKTSRKGAANDLCWFCAARPADTLHAGSCLGAMVYGTHMSLPPDLLGDDELRDRAAGHLSDCAQICADCLFSFGGGRPLLSDYRRQMAANSEDTHSEMLWYDMQMLESDERTHRFGCWFGLYSDDGVGQKLWSRTLLSLFASGLRFAGGIPLRPAELSLFFRAFALRLDDANCNADESIRAAFMAHITDCFTAESPEMLSNLARTRACIFDISAAKLLGTSKEGM